MLTALPTTPRNGSPMKRSPLDRSRDPIGWRLLAEAGFRRMLAPGAVLAHNSDQPDAVILVEEGAVKVVGVAENGSTAVLAVRPAGTIICEFAVSTGERHLTSIIGVLPATVITVPAKRLLTVLQHRSANALLLLESAIGRIHEADRRRVEYASYTVPERICRVLIDLVEVFRLGAGLGPTVIPLAQMDLAGLAGASREATAKVLRKLRQVGAIRTHRARIVVLRTDLIADGMP
jgi:CRP/FNR family transcriptional regulator, cyclic AMP receptor protein